MAHRRNKEDRDENRAHIRDVLMQKWDPIGISGICPDDEYDSYINTIYLMLQVEGTDHRHVADHLLDLAVNAMGLSDKPPLREKCTLAAAAFLALRPDLATRGGRR